MILEDSSVSKELWDKPQEWREIERLWAGLFKMQICTTISPDRQNEINEKLKEYEFGWAGMRYWTLDESVEAIEYKECKGRWHYICEC